MREARGSFPVCPILASALVQRIRYNNSYWLLGLSLSRLRKTKVVEIERRDRWKLKYFNRHCFMTEFGDELMARSNAPVVRRLAGPRRAVGSRYDDGVPVGSKVAHEVQRQSARGALQSGHGQNGNRDSLWHSYQGLWTVAHCGRAENSVRRAPVSGWSRADQRPVRVYLQGKV